MHHSRCKSNQNCSSGDAYESVTSSYHSTLPAVFFVGVCVVCCAVGYMLKLKLKLGCDASYARMCVSASVCVRPSDDEVKRCASARIRCVCVCVVLRCNAVRDSTSAVWCVETRRNTCACWYVDALHTAQHCAATQVRPRDAIQYTHTHIYSQCRASTTHHTTHNTCTCTLTI